MSPEAALDAISRPNDGDERRNAKSEATDSQDSIRQLPDEKSEVKIAENTLRLEDLTSDVALLKEQILSVPEQIAENHNEVDKVKSKLKEINTKVAKVAPLEALETLTMRFKNFGDEMRRRIGEKAPERLMNRIEKRLNALKEEMTKACLPVRHQIQGETSSPVEMSLKASTSSLTIHLAT